MVIKFGWFQFKRKDKLKEHIKRMHTGDKKLKVANAKRDKAAAASVAQQPKSAAKFVPKVLMMMNFLFLSISEWKNDCLAGEPNVFIFNLVFSLE